MVDFVEIATSSDNLELSIEEIHIEKDSALAGRPLSEVIQRDKMNVVVVGIQHAQAAWSSTRWPAPSFTPAIT